MGEGEQGSPVVGPRGHAVGERAVIVAHRPEAG
jgi:hypothetical protein